MLRPIAAIAPLVVFLAGCFQPMRPSPVHLPGPTPSTEVGAPSVVIPPPVQVTTALPKPSPTVKPETYSVVVNNVRVQELLFALARDARLNIDVHPGISGTVTLNAVDQTLPQLLNRIARQTDMRWELDGPNLTIMPDSPYLRLYKIDYVNMERQTQGTVSVAAQIATTGGQPGATGAAGGGGGAAGSGSNTSSVSVRNISNNRFWVTLEKNIQELLRETDKMIPGGAPVQAPPRASAPGAQGAPAGDEQPAPTTPNVQFREAASVIANPEAGILSIRATSRQHEKITEFLDQVLVSVKRQVLLEGTIVEVRLNNQYQQGIDWARLRDGLAGFSVGQGAGISAGGVGGQTLLGIAPGTLTATPTGSILTMGYSARNIAATVRLLESFGTVRVLSSPRISVLNNQTALLKVVDNRVYFTISANTSQNVNTTSTTFTSTPNVVPVGFVMNITPQISDTDQVVLNVKPTITRIVGFVEDPNPVLRNPCLVAGGGVLGGGGSCNIPAIVSRIPEVQTREMESVLRVINGQLAVMGGLIQDSIEENEDSIPGANRVPIIGGFFGNQTRQNTKTELVIFLRPVVVKDPSLDGDFRGYRVLLPSEDFLTQPNPGRKRLDIEGRR